MDTELVKKILYYMSINEESILSYHGGSDILMYWVVSEILRQINKEDDEILYDFTFRIIKIQSLLKTNNPRQFTLQIN